MIENSLRDRAVNISVRRNIRGGKAKYPELEDAIMHFIQDERKLGRSVNDKMIKRKCQVLLLKHQKGGFDECFYGITCRSGE